MPQVHEVEYHAGVLSGGRHVLWYANADVPAVDGGSPETGGGEPGGPVPPGGGGGQPGGEGPGGGGTPGGGDVQVGGPISRQDILDRGRYWTQQGVPYSMSNYTGDAQGKSYRTDCSGLVSMALKLDNSLSTVTLPEVVHPIAKDDLKPGDIVGNLGPGTGGADGHVMIFNGWVDESRTSFYTIEQTPPQAVEKTQQWGTKYTSNAWRYNNVID